MEFKLIDVIQHIANIIILFILLRTLIYKPVLNFITQRNQRMADEQQKLVNERLEVAKQREAANALLAQSKQEAEEHVAASLTRAKTVAHEQLEQVDAEIADKQKQAQAELDEQLNTRRQNMDHEISQKAMQLAAEILKREIKAEDNEQVFATFFQKAK